MQQPEITAMRMRFAHTYTDGVVMVHVLPNRIMILSLHPEFSRNHREITGLALQVGAKILEGDRICKVDDIEIVSPFEGKILEIGKLDLELFKKGATGSFILAASSRSQINMEKLF